MTSLTNEQKELLVDYYFCCASEGNLILAARLICENPEAADLYRKLEATMGEFGNSLNQKCPDSLVEKVLAKTAPKKAPSYTGLLLEHYFKCGNHEDKLIAQGLIEADNDAAALYRKLECNLDVVGDAYSSDCPDYLVDATFNKIQEAMTFKTPLEKLIEKQRRNNDVSHWSSWSTLAKVAAMVAMIAFVAAVYMPGTNYLRQNSNKNLCKINLGNVSRGLASFAGDNSGYYPVVKGASNDSWWNVGNQDSPQKSGTSGLWLMVKGDYVKLEDFLCPGGKCPSNRLRSIDVAKFRNDFPGSDYVNFSFRVVPNRSAKLENMKSIIAADSNPILEDRCSSNREFFEKFILTDKMLEVASKNHARKGQNMLRSDGSVYFNRSRVVNGDDVYTIQDQIEYTGSELPVVAEDIFLIP